MTDEGGEGRKGRGAEGEAQKTLRLILLLLLMSDPNHLPTVPENSEAVTITTTLGLVPVLLPPDDFGFRLATYRTKCAVCNQEVKDDIDAVSYAYKRESQLYDVRIVHPWCKKK
jgi:hypothetical protein